MSNIPAELKYTTTHEWIRHDGDGVVTIGITEHAQELLGDLVHVDMPEEGDDIATGDDAACVESVKAASDVYAPLTGSIVEINEDLEDSPELINSDPYGDGWLFKMKVEDISELDSLLDAEGYEGSVEED